MKKKLEAELISIAHRILKLKNKSELIQLQQEARNLYEKLSVLMFVEENFAELKPTIGRAEADQILETAFDEKDTFTPESPKSEDKIANTLPELTAEAEPDPAEPDTGNEEEMPHEPVEENLEETAVEEPSEDDASQTMPEPPEEIVIEKEVDEVIAEAEEEVAAANEEIAQEEETTIPAEENAVEPAASGEDAFFKPAFEWAFEPKTEEKTEAPAEPKVSGQIAFEDLLGAGYVDPVFVKPEETPRPAEIKYEEPIADVIAITRKDDNIPVYKMNNAEIGDKAITLNDRLSKGITVGLNDRIAFVKNLFGNSNEDYNRVLSQLITFDTFAEAQEFIDQMVKPDYNNWDGKDEYAQRFMEVIEKKFS